MSRPARTAYYVLGTAGLAALAVALVGPKRLEREHPVEQVGKRLRALMPWINAKSV